MKTLLPFRESDSQDCSGLHAVLTDERVDADCTRRIAVGYGDVNVVCDCARACQGIRVLPRIRGPVQQGAVGSEAHGQNHVGNARIGRLEHWEKSDTVARGCLDDAVQIRGRSSGNHGGAIGEQPVQELRTVGGQIRPKDVKAEEREKNCQDFDFSHSGKHNNVIHGAYPVKL